MCNFSYMVALESERSGQARLESGMHFHELTMDSLTGDAVSFEQFAGEHCLVVNVASK